MTKEEKEFRNVSWEAVICGLPSTGRLLPGPRVGGSPVYAMRLEALKEAHAYAVEELRQELLYRSEGISERKRERSCEYGPMFRADLRMRCAGIRAMRIVLGSDA